MLNITSIKTLEHEYVPGQRYQYGTGVDARWRLIVNTFDFKGSVRISFDFNEAMSRRVVRSSATPEDFKIWIDANSAKLMPFDMFWTCNWPDRAAVPA